jgi:soluble lytic murein transglycosylase-like protein
MKLREKEAASITLCLGDLILWVSIVAIIVFVFAPQLYGSREVAETGTTEAVTSEGPTISRIDLIAMAAERQPRPEPALAMLVCEPAKVRIASSPSVDHRALALEGSTPSAPGKEKERVFHPLILKAANRYQVESALIKAIIMAESNYNPKAVSKRGAKGLMQLMPKTAEALGVGDSFDPEHNINAGVRYFRKLLNQFEGDVRLALAAYNAGSRKVREYQGVPPFGSTRRYIKRVFEYHQYYKNQTAW